MELYRRLQETEVPHVVGSFIGGGLLMIFAPVRFVMYLYPENVFETGITVYDANCFLAVAFGFLLVAGAAHVERKRILKAIENQENKEARDRR